MKLTVIAALLLFLLVAGCGGGADTADLERKVEALTARIKTLEDNLLASDKKMIQHEQAMRLLNERMKEMDNYFMKLRTGESR